MIKAVSYGRAGIIGNPSDGYGGSMIACSIKNKAEVTIEKSDQLIIVNRFGTRVLNWRNEFDNKGDYFDVVRSVLRYFRLYNLKAHISIWSDIPEQAGLGGSTAVFSAVLSAITGYLGLKYNRYHLAEINRDIELNYMRCHCGYQDAYMTTFGGLNYLDFRGKEYYLNINEEIYATVEPLQECVDQLPFVVAHTGVKHHSGNFHRPIRERWLEGEEMVVNGYREIAHLAREGKKALIKKDWDELAYLMNKNHEIQNEICDSGEQNNYMISIAKRNGALAAKLAGAGGGGTIIALTFKPERVKKALKECGASDFVDLYPGCPGTAVEYEGNDERYMAVHG